MIISDPSEVLAALLIKLGLGGRPTANPTWPITKGNNPPQGDKWITLVDVTAFTEGKLMNRGTTVTHERVQIQIRAKEYHDAQYQARLMNCNLSKVLNEVVNTLDGESVEVAAVSIILQPAFLEFEEKNRRTVFVSTVQLSINGVL